MKFLLFLGSFVGLVIKLSSTGQRVLKQSVIELVIILRILLSGKGHIFLQDLKILGIVMWKLGRCTQTGLSDQCF